MGSAARATAADLSASQRAQLQAAMVQQITFLTAECRELRADVADIRAEQARVAAERVARLNRAWWRRW